MMCDNEIIKKIIITKPLVDVELYLDHRINSGNIVKYLYTRDLTEVSQRKLIHQRYRKVFE